MRIVVPKPAAKTATKTKPATKPTPAAIPPAPTEPRISRDAAKLRMAYVMCDYLGIGVSASSGAVYEALNAAGYFWYPYRMAWGRLGREEAGADVAEGRGGE